MAIKSYHKKLNFVKNKAEMKIFFAVFAMRALCLKKCINHCYWFKPIANKYNPATDVNYFLV